MDCIDTNYKSEVHDGGRKKKKIKYKSKSVRLKYNYTEDEKRNIWLENVYPLGFMLINKISNIPWNEYKFKGFTECIIHEEVNDEEVIIQKELKGVAKLLQTPYYIFGGAACELYAKIYPKVVDITDLVDPTSDIDIKILSPVFRPYKNKNIIFELPMKKELGYTKLNSDYTEWLFEKIVTLCIDIEKYFDRTIFSLPNKKDIKRDYELINADIVDYIGPLLITRVLLNDRDMIKIQVTTKVYGIINHLVEFILSINENIEDGGIKQLLYYNKPYKYKTPTSNIYIENPTKLFNHQLKGLEDRYSVSIEENLYKYKFYNHCARIIYMSYLLVYLKDNNIIKKLHRSEVLKFNKYINGSKNLNEICKSFSKYNIQNVVTENIKLLLK